MTYDSTGPPRANADSISISREPPRWWTLILPCLLTLPVSAWCVLIAALASLYRCFDTCMPSDGLLTAVGGAEFILGAITVVTLIAGLALAARRRALRRVIWIACVLACLGGGLVYAWASASP